MQITKGCTAFPPGRAHGREEKNKKILHGQVCAGEENKKNANRQASVEEENKKNIRGQASAEGKKGEGK